jgi:two-component system cell cycle sensor histidine kinase/response regulator CckA
MSVILVVDDEQVVRTVLARLLEEEGRLVLTAGSGEQALKLARQHTLDVALVDKNLPGESGLDVARSLKEVQTDLEFILLTGYASIESAIEAVQIGAYDYLTKPVDDFAELRRKVRHAQERCSLRRGQKELLARLSESELRFRRLVESSPDALLLLDTSTGKLLDGNPASAALYGMEASKLPGLSLATLGIGPTEEATHVEMHLRADGTQFWAETRGIELVIDNIPVRAISVRDVSVRERAERERNELQERLRLSQKMDAIGRLAGGVAHDFNNLLTVILSHIDFLAPQFAPSTPVGQELSGIEAAAQRAAALTSQLLLFSRRKRGEAGIVDLNAVVHDVRKLLDRIIGENVKVKVSAQQSLWKVRADADQLAQVLLNLMVNARDAMPKGGEVSIETSNCEIAEQRVVHAGVLLPGQHVRLSVADQGTGMTPEVMARLFEPFFTTKEQGRGTGLGLATVYGIVQAAGGAMEVRSTLGLGSSFVLYLPATTATADEVAGIVHEVKPARGETVLLVEDEAPIRMLLARTLENSGYTVLQANDGREALEVARQKMGPIELLVADIVMPKLGGIELAKELLSARPAVRVLFLTGYTDSPTPHLDDRTGFLQKPFTSRALLHEVRRLLDHTEVSKNA